jgi:exonuclease VII large subunit
MGRMKNTTLLALSWLITIISMGVAAHAVLRKPQPAPSAPVEVLRAKPLEAPATPRRVQTVKAIPAAEIPALGHLQQQLDEKTAEVEELKHKLALREQTTRRRPQGGSFEERMQKLKESDPERYEKMRQRMQAVSKGIATSIDGKGDFFVNLDVETMSAEQQATHVALLEKLNATRELLSLINENPDDEAVGELRQELHQEMRTLRPLLDQERRVVLEQFGTQLGYEPAQAKEFADYIDYVNEATSYRSIWRGAGRSAGGTRGR